MNEQDRVQNLVVEHLHLVRHVVNQVSTRYPSHVDRDELWNAGALGLVDAARRYDPDAGFAFPRYAMIRIRGAIIDSTRSRDWATRQLRRHLRAARHASEALAHQQGREPTTAEVAAAVGITGDELERHRAAAVNASLLHLDQRVGTDDDEDATLGDLVQETSRDALPDEQLEHRELVGTLKTAVDHLPPTQRHVVERYYFQGAYLRDIAGTLGVTEARVSQLRTEALNALRSYFATTFENVAEVDDRSPGRRTRHAYVTTLATHTTWRDRLAAADDALEQAG